VILSDEEKKELLDMAASENLRHDFQRLSENRHNPFIINGKVNMDRLLAFLTDFNCFINHEARPFRRTVEKCNKL
jgi:hypothetical protein